MCLSSSVHYGFTTLYSIYLRFDFSLLYLINMIFLRFRLIICYLLRGFCRWRGRRREYYQSSGARSRAEPRRAAARMRRGA